MSDGIPNPFEGLEAQLRRADRFRDTVDPVAAIAAYRTFTEFLRPRLPELRIAIEYDSVGKHGLEHVGRREDADRRKDRAVRASGWDVVRVRTGKLEPIGPHDVLLSAWSKKGQERLLDALRDIRGPLFVDAYLS